MRLERDPMRLVQISDADYDDRKGLPGTEVPFAVNRKGPDREPQARMHMNGKADAPYAAAATGDEVPAAQPPDAVEPSGSSEVRTIGRRTAPPAGILRAPTPEEQEWVRRMSAYRTRVPKGVFRYASAEEANADWDRWRAALLAEGAGLDWTDDGG